MTSPGIHPLLLLACESFHDAVEGGYDDAALNRQLGRVQLGLLCEVFVFGELLLVGGFLNRQIGPFPFQFLLA